MEINSLSSITMSRASLEQVNTIIEFMEKHPMLALGGNKTIEDRCESKALWQECASALNSIKGARKSTKGWVKYWVDKKCNLRKLALRHCNGDTSTIPKGFSPLDKKILSIVGFHDGRRAYSRFKRVKSEMEPESMEQYDEEQSVELDELDKPIEFVDRPHETDDERHAALMDKLFQVMSEQASALTKVAQAAATQAHALERLAECSRHQTSAIERVADSVERIAESFSDFRNSMANVEGTVRRAYGNS